MEDTTEFSKCPCCSEKLFKDCCKPVIEDHSKAVTAEQLMRSRYTAFTLSDNQYLMDSWAAETRPESAQIEDSGIQWLTLEVLNCEKGGEKTVTDWSILAHGFLALAISAASTRNRVY